MQTFPLLFTLRALQVAGRYGGTLNQESNETKTGISAKLKAVIEATGIIKAEPEVGVTYEESLRKVVQYFHDSKRISEISFEVVRLSGIYLKLIAEVKAKDPFSGNVVPVGNERAGATLKVANEAMKETLTVHFNYIESLLNMKK